MSASLFSASWYRIARLRPRLRPQVRVQRQHWRDQRWYLLSDANSGRQHRINEAAYRFIGRCDGQHTVHEVWSDLLHAEPDAAPTQDEVLTLLGQLGEMELLQSERAGNTEALLRRRGEGRKRRRSSMLNPFSFKLPLGDPSRWLNRLDPLSRCLFTPAVFWFWLLVMAVSTLAAATEWAALRNHAALHLADNANLAIAWLLYPLMKAVHELGHAMAVRSRGGEVHEAGIGLWLLVPAPYVDASAATAFAHRLARAAVGAAGVIVELTLAALGFWVWWLTQPGLVNQLGFGALFIGTASTLLFNGNPLLRFDAYHVLCDLFALPNLAARSGAWWSQRLGRLLLGSRAEAPEHAAGEAKWLWAYAPLSLAYRCVLSLGMVLWLGGHALLLGLAALAYTVVTVLLRPLAGWSRQAMNAAQPGRELARLRLRLALVALTAALLLGVLPLPYSTVAPAIVYLPERAQVRPEVDGFVAELPVADGVRVAPGDLLLRLSNPELVAQRDRFASRLEGLRVEQFQQLLKDGSAAQNLALDIERTQAEVQRADERLGQLQLRAQVAGRLVMPRQGDLMGAYMRQGVTLGHVLAPEQMRVRAAVPEADAQLVRHRFVGAQVRLADAPEQSWPAQRGADVPAATHTLPSAALADVGGGPYTSDPDQKDGTKSLEPVFLIDLSLAGHRLERVGGRAWVNFDHGSEPLAQQIYRRATQLFLRHFAPSA